MSVITSSWVGPRQKSLSCLSLILNNSGPIFSHLLVSSHNSFGWTIGIKTSWAPEESISSLTIFSTFLRTFNPKGSHVYIPEATFLIIPALSISLWLITSASWGASLRVGSNNFENSILSIML